MEIVFRRMVAVKYTGCNVEEVLSVVREQSITRSVWSAELQDEDLLVLHEQSDDGTLHSTWKVPLGYWVVMAPDFGLKDILAEKRFRSQYGSLNDTIEETKAAILQATEEYVDATVQSSPPEATA
jgi:hypothetical protein